MKLTSLFLNLSNCTFLAAKEHK